MAAKGGEATKRKMASDPGYYSRIAKIRKRRIPVMREQSTPSTVNVTFIDRVNREFDEIYG